MKRFIPPVLLLLVMMACEPKPGNIEEEYALGPRAVVVGDSLSSGGRLTLHAELGKVFATKIAAIGGSRYSTMLPYSETYAEDKSEVAVLALGTNDRHLPFNLTASLEALNQTYNLFTDSCTVGITVTTNHPNPDVNIKAVAINEAAKLRADVMVDWDAYDQEPGMTQTDGTHPTQEGYQLRAELIAAAARNCGQEPPPTTTTTTTTTTTVPDATTTTAPDTTTTTAPDTTTTTAPDTTTTTVSE